MLKIAAQQINFVVMQLQQNHTGTLAQHVLRQRRGYWITKQPRTGIEAAQQLEVGEQPRILRILLPDSASTCLRFSGLAGLLALQIVQPAAAVGVQEDEGLVL